MGIFRRAPRRPPAAAHAATELPGGDAAAAFAAAAEAAVAGSGRAAGLDAAGLDLAGLDPASLDPVARDTTTGHAAAQHAGSSRPLLSRADRRVSPRPANFSPEAVAASIAADAERFVASFPYAASPVPQGALDFTRASLTHIEAMLGALHKAGRPLPERLHQGLAVYLYETARREFGGRYLRFEAPDPLILLVGEPRAQVGLCAMSRLAARVANGPDDSIVHFYASISPLIAEGAEITLR